MYKSAMIGDRESVLGFSSLGFIIREADCADEAAAALSELAERGDVAVIFITEELAAEIGEAIAKYKDMPLPAITAIPSVKGGSGFGAASLRDAVIRAVGADILANE